MLGSAAKKRIAMQTESSRHLTTHALHDAEARRLEHDEHALALIAEADPILRTMLAATRACRDQLARERRGA